MTNRIRKTLNLLTLSAMLVFALLVGATSGQTGTTTVSGTVADAQGAVVGGATVKLINEAKGFSRTATTSGGGTYIFSSVPPDVYKIEVEANGFKKLVISNVVVLVDKPSDVNASLEAGNISEVVNVTGGELSSIVNTQDGSLGNNFVSRQIQELPLEGRNVANLLSLQPGVTQGGEVAGSRSDQANITLDGVDVNDQQNGTAFTPVLRVTPDSVDEFRVTTTNADTSKGRSSGAQISLSTKSGSNEFHGALYEYHRNTVTTANDYFSNADGRFIATDFAVLQGNAKVGDPRSPRPKLIRNLYGGRLGGPIVKDRFFFFYNYEALRESRETPVNRTVPLPSLGLGTVRFRSTGGVITSITAAQINALTTNGQPGGTPVVDVNPVALGVLADAARKYPANNLGLGDGLNTAGFRFNAKVPAEENTHTMRFDYKLTRDEKHTLNFRGIFQNDFFDFASQFPDTPSARRISKPFGIVAGHSWLIGNNKVNNFRYGYTRQKFSDSADASGDTITFRGVFSPFSYFYPFSRQTNTQNFTNDFSWTMGSHSLQFGTNIRIVRNSRSDETDIHDSAVINRSFFAGSGSVLTSPILNTINPATGTNYTISANILAVRDAVAAVLGRYSQYQFNSNFNRDGSRLAAGQPVVRKFATEEYDLYFQDSWKWRSNLTLNYGLRYGLSRPVYETQGFQAAPNIGLQEYLNRRIAASASGQNYGDTPSEALIVELAGPANGKGNVYPWDRNNFQPAVSVAWSPNFDGGFLKKLFGSNSASVFRGGFRITNDYFGQALAVNFDANNTLGFASSLGISANTFNVSTNPGPQFTGFNQTIRSLPLPPGGSIPTTLTFPQQQPLDDQRRIEGSLDKNLVSPINYQWNFTYGREMPKGIYVEASYIGRIARNLLASRDIMTPNNIKDPVSGQTFYEAAQILEAHRRAGTNVNLVPNQPFFENMYAAGQLDALLFAAGLSNTRAAYGFMAVTANTPGCAGAPLFGCYDNGDDWTFLQDVFDGNTGRFHFYNRQYGALSAYGTIASSEYHGGTLSVRQRFRGLSWDANYTFSKSMDDASGVQTSGVFGSAFIHNALRQQDNYSVSDFDVRHIFNVNSIWEIPVGRGKTFFSGMNKFADALLGGWQLSSVFRYNTGFPITDGFVSVYGWPTNWNVRSYVTRFRDIKVSPTKNGPGGLPNLFSDVTAAYQSFRSAAPGETGDRNVLRYPGYIVLDMGLAKSFNMPWKEGHKLQIRAESFNLTNTQRFTAADTIFGLDAFRSQPASSFGQFSAIQGTPRIFQFAVRYDF